MATQDYHKIKFLVSGFARINAQEYQLLQKMMEKGHLVVDLLLDRPYKSDLPDPLTLFFNTGKDLFPTSQRKKEN